MKTETMQCDTCKDFHITSKQLAVSRIRNGTIIDHITSGQALNIIRLDSFYPPKFQISLGINLSSKSMGKKDILKIENKYISQTEAMQIAIFSPFATISSIESYKIIAKYKVTLPKVVENIFTCPNPCCITNSAITFYSRFTVIDMKKKVMLQCNYCEHTFSYHEQKTKLPPL